MTDHLRLANVSLDNANDAEDHDHLMEQLAYARAEALVDIAQSLRTIVNQGWKE